MISEKELKEVQAPYTIRLEDSTISQETVIIMHKNEPLVVLVPFDEYQNLLQRAQVLSQKPEERGSDEFERQWKASERLLPKLLKSHLGQWVGIVNESVVVFGQDSQSVLDQISENYGNVPMCIREVRAKPRVYKMPHRRIS